MTLDTAEAITTSSPPSSKGGKKKSSSILSFKTIFLYPGIILSAGWTMLNIVRIIGYVN